MDIQLVSSKIGRNGIFARGIKIDAMRVWPFLPLRIDTLTFVLNGRVTCSQTTVILHGKTDHISTDIVRYKDVFSVVVNHKVARSATERRLLIQLFQIGRLWVNLTRRHIATGFPVVLDRFIDCIEKLSAWMKCNKRRLGGFRDQPDRSSFPVLSIEISGVNPFAVTARVSPEINPILVLNIILRPNILVVGKREHECHQNHGHEVKTQDTRRH